MREISQKFNVLLAQERKAFLPYFTALFPSPNLFKELILCADRVGADFIEIGLPFSDPLADGPTIQQANEWVLTKNFTLERGLKIIEELKGKIKTPLILMSYLNPIIRKGIDYFAQEIKIAGLSGVIIGDLPLEESEPIQRTLNAHGLELIFLVAPTTSSARVMEINKKSDGFLYVVSITGTTGARENLPPNLKNYLIKVRKLSSKPLCVGFGVSHPRQAKVIAQYSDGVIVGSVLIKEIMANLEHPSLLSMVENLLTSFRQVI